MSEIVILKAELKSLEHKIKEGLPVTEDDLKCLLYARLMVSEQAEEIRRYAALVRQKQIEVLIKDRRVKDLKALV